MTLNTKMAMPLFTTVRLKGVFAKNERGIGLFHNIFTFYDRRVTSETFISVSRISIMKTTFSIFTGNAPVVRTSCKRNINFKKHKMKNIMKYQLYTNASKNNR